MTKADELAAEMHAFYPRYIDSFNGDDQAAYIANFSFPCVVLGGKQAVTVVNDAATWVTMMANAKAIMRSKGWARTGIEKTYAWRTAPDTGLLMSDFLRYRSDGTVLMRGRCSRSHPVATSAARSTPPSWRTRWGCANAIRLAWTGSCGPATIRIPKPPGPRARS